MVVSDYDLAAQFARQLDKLCPGWPRRRFVAALSGGADSTALALLASAALAPGRLILAHLNHGLRAEAARADENFCRSLAQRLGRPFFSEAAPVAALARQRGRGLEEAGRWARYQFLEKIRLENKADYILTGHHQDDVAETILLGLLRGIGPAGLAAIPPRLGAVARPLLAFSRGQIESWLTAQSESWREDASNQSGLFLRNRVRSELKPLMEKMAPGCSIRLARLSQDLRLEEDYWQTRLAEAALNTGRRESRAGLAYNRQALAALEPALAKRLIRQGAWEIQQKFNLKEPPDHLAIDSIWRLAREPWRARNGWDLPGGLRVEATKTRLHLGPASRLARPRLKAKQPYLYRLKRLKPLLVDETGHTFQLTELPAKRAAPYLRPGGLKDNQYLLTEQQMFSAGLKIRSPQNGDFLRLKKGRQKLNRIFGQAGIPGFWRSLWPVLEDEEILWVAGLKRRHYEPASSPRYFLLEVSGPEL